MLAGFGVFFCKWGNSEYELQVCCLMAGPQLCILDLFPFVGYKEAQEILRLLIQIFAGLLHDGWTTSLYPGSLSFGWFEEA
jgi:hypothetical protein